MLQQIVTQQTLEIQKLKVMVDEDSEDDFENDGEHHLFSDVQSKERIGFTGLNEETLSSFLSDTMEQL